MKKIALAVLTIGVTVGLTLTTAPAQAANKAGGACVTVGQITKIGSYRYECQVNNKTKKTVWTKLIKPAAFNCVQSKKALPMLRDSLATLEDYFETIQMVYADTDPFYIKFKKDFEQNKKDLATLERGIKLYC